MAAGASMFGDGTGNSACPQNFLKTSRASTLWSSGSDGCRQTRVSPQPRFASSVNEMTKQRTRESFTFNRPSGPDLVRSEISRSSFIKAAAPLALGLGASARGQIPLERGRFSADDLPLAREQLLKQVNAERASSGLSQLQLDELACKVAGEHARDMVEGDFLSHWGSDGRKPYHRYSFAGGTEAVQENVSSAQNIQ